MFQDYLCSLNFDVAQELYQYFCIPQSQTNLLSHYFSFIFSNEVFGTMAVLVFTLY